MTAKMHAAFAPAGDKLVLTEMPRTAPGPCEVQIEVAAAGLNRADLAQKAGAYPPPPGASPILGLEVSGIVSAVGPGTELCKVGDRVAALLAGGGYSTHVCADEGSVLPVPSGLDLALACCFPEALFTVWANVFDRAGLKPGETFLCHGATSGIGVMALQMAKFWGAPKIFGTAGSEEKCKLARELGATRAINYREEAFEEIVKAEGGADVTLDMVGGGIHPEKHLGGEARRADHQHRVSERVRRKREFRAGADEAPVADGDNAAGAARAGEAAHPRRRGAGFLAACDFGTHPARARWSLHAG